ncbi:uncharacterized protein EI90DRAFT_3012141 [Cantharellus anzutake]|uniref:uncharacterized protein n=1 Tax=Cantharellus anzutake TaxID=1750568 RepID=UPI001905F452|nr:uncharacterized protein EI90DRAFT_3012141 [Cantharellus anzutake]KAF8341625.1 hypothetical protein EI90DRAFT_3012141 [Cantharellus anzutake]
MVPWVSPPQTRRESGTHAGLAQWEANDIAGKTIGALYGRRLSLEKILQFFLTAFRFPLCAVRVHVGCRERAAQSYNALNTLARSQRGNERDREITESHPSYDPPPTNAHIEFHFRTRKERKNYMYTLRQQAESAMTPGQNRNIGWEQVVARNSSRRKYTMTRTTNTTHAFSICIDPGRSGSCRSQRQKVLMSLERLYRSNTWITYCSPQWHWGSPQWVLTGTSVIWLCRTLHEYQARGRETLATSPWNTYSLHYEVRMWMCATELELFRWRKGKWASWERYLCTSASISGCLGI